jgi:probable HAF family extracellular repeat protein
VTGGSYTAATVNVTCPPRQYDQQKKCTEHPEHAYLYSNGSMSDLGTLGGISSEGRAVNLSGQVAGWSQTNNNNNIDAFVTSGKKTIDLGALAPFSGWENEATGINDFGEVVGW